MLDLTDSFLESVLETPLKLKILHLSKQFYSTQHFLPPYDTKFKVKIILTLLYSINLKKVLCGKARNRITLKCFDKFGLSLYYSNLNNIRKNKNFLESDYLSTTYINSLYESCFDNAIE
jgi:hypothetical protein